MITDISVAILAGGQSRRMGTDKSFVEVDGVRLIDRVVNAVRALALPVFLVANNPERYRSLGLPIFPDVIPGKGSLGGIYTALYRSRSAYTLCVACDMPFLEPALLWYLLEQRDGCDVVVPETGGRLQALHAVYNRSCLLPIAAQLQRDQLAIQRLFANVNTRIVPESALLPYDPLLQSFINLNTPQDLAQATSAGERTPILL